MSGEKDTCKIVPELQLDSHVDYNRECGSTLALDAYNDLQSKSVKIKTERNSGPDAGSGFFVRDGNEVVTAAHVVKNTSSIKVEMPTGETLDAQIVNYDDINDLALLKIPGLAADKSRAIELDTSGRDLTGEKILTLGTPGLTNQEKVLSVGTILGRTAMQNILQMGDSKSFAGLQEAFDKGSLAVQKDATAYVLGERIASDQAILPGQSGSGQVGTDGKLVGVVTDQVGKSHSLSTPVEKVSQLLNMTGKFDFLYTRKSDFDLNPVKTAGGDVLLGASMLPYVNRVAPALYGAKRLLDLPSDVSTFASASSGDYKTEHGRLAAEDVGFGAGGLALSIGVLSKIPKLKYAGMAAFGVAALSSTISGFEHKHLHYEATTRKDGSARQPFMWNFNIAGNPVD